jgi:hypothetical protein
MWEGHRRQSQPVRRTPKEFSIEAASGLLNCDRRKNSSFSTVSAQSGSARSSKAWRSTCAHKGAGCGLVADGCVGIVGPKIGLVVNAASGQSCCRFFCARLAPADGARVGRRRLHFTKRQFSRFTAGLRLKSREGHANESNALRRREHGTDQVEGDFMQPVLFGSPIPSIGYEWTTETRHI